MGESVDASGTTFHLDDRARQLFKKNKQLEHELVDARTKLRVRVCGCCRLSYCCFLHALFVS